MASPSKKTGDEQVGQRIAERRTALQMSREELARQIGASYGLVAQVETGWRMPSHEKQRLIAKALGAGLDELFGEQHDDGETEYGSQYTADSASPPDPQDDRAGIFARAAAAFPVGKLRTASASSPKLRAGAPSRAPSGGQQSYYSSKPTFDDAVELAARSLRELPASRRLDALSRLQLIVMREVVDDESKRAGGSMPMSGWITELAPNEVFVFGSNAEGAHAAGAARTAFEKFGAEWGEGRGHHGQSYAVVTMSGMQTLREEIAALLEYARAHPELRFLVTPIGTGIAGFRADEVAPLFAEAPDNVVLPMEFQHGL